MVSKSLGFQQEANSTGKDLFLQEDEDTRTKLESALLILLVDVRILVPAAELDRVGGHRGETTMISRCVASSVDRCQTKNVVKSCCHDFRPERRHSFWDVSKSFKPRISLPLSDGFDRKSLKKWRSARNGTVF